MLSGNAMNKHGSSRERPRSIMEALCLSLLWSWVAGVLGFLLVLVIMKSDVGHERLTEDGVGIIWVILIAAISGIVGFVVALSPPTKRR